MQHTFIKLNSILCLQVNIRSKHAVRYLKGQFQSLCGLCQQINSEHEYMLALAWVRTCLIVHSFVACHEDHEWFLGMGWWRYEWGEWEGGQWTYWRLYLGWDRTTTPRGDRSATEAPTCTRSPLWCIVLNFLNSMQQSCGHNSVNVEKKTSYGGCCCGCCCDWICASCTWSLRVSISYFCGTFSLS